MLVKCIKYLNIRDEVIIESNIIKIGVCYPVLALTFGPRKNEISYYIQGSEFTNYIPFWANSEQFEIVDNSTYSDWIVDLINFEGNKVLTLQPKKWYENEEWFLDEIIDETPRAVELFIKERDKIIQEMLNRGVPKWFGSK